MLLCSEKYIFTVGIKVKFNALIKGIYPSLILASDLNALFEGACLLWD